MMGLTVANQDKPGEVREVDKHEIRLLECEMEVETREDKANVLSGYVIKWGALSEDMGGWREQFTRGAFENSLQEQPVFAFWSHDRTKILGNTKNGSLNIQEDNKGLRFKVTLPDTQEAKDAMTLIRDKYITGMSFGFRGSVVEWDETNPKTLIRTVKEALLYEISPVAMPAYSQGYVNARDTNTPMKDYIQAQKNTIARACKIREEQIKNL